MDSHKGGRRKSQNHKHNRDRDRDRDRHPQTSTGVTASDPSTIHLDGSTLEGGGQLVRVALTLSALTGTAVHITNIRAGRGSKSGGWGGLKESHLAALQVLAEECSARVQGAEVGSREVVFEPTKKRGARSEEKWVRVVELKKPGSVWLIWQALFPYLAFQGRRVELTLKGGTNVSSSMSGEYVQQVLLPVCERIGLPKVEVEVVSRGWAGNASEVGEVRIVLGGGDGEASQRHGLEGFEVRDRGAITKISVSVVAHPDGLRRALLDRAVEEVTSRFVGQEIEIITEVNEDSGDIRRLYVLLVAHTKNGFRLGQDYLGTGKALKNQKETDMMVDGAVKKVVGDLEREIRSGGCVDEYLQDQLVVFQALARGKSIVDAGEGRREGTLHTKTVRWVCEEILEIHGFKLGKDGECSGFAYRRAEYRAQGKDEKSRGENEKKEPSNNDAIAEGIDGIDLNKADH